jgi:hypothetical protein
MEQDKPRRDPAHLTAPNLLREAKALLIERGWAQGAVQRRSDPNCMCAAEACQVVWKGSGPISPMKALACAIDQSFEPMRHGNTHVVIVLRWNDEPGRTVEQVYAAFDRAAEIADEAEKNYVPL